MKAHEKRTTSSRRDRINQTFLMIPRQWMRRSLMLHATVALALVLPRLVSDRPLQRPPNPMEPSVQVDLIGPDDPEMARIIADMAVEQVGYSQRSLPSTPSVATDIQRTLSQAQPAPDAENAIEEPAPPTPAPQLTEKPAAAKSDLAAAPTASPTPSPTKPPPTRAPTKTPPTSAPKPRPTRIAEKKRNVAKPVVKAAQAVPAPASILPPSAAGVATPSPKKQRVEARRQALFSSLHVQMEGVGRQVLSGRKRSDGASASGVEDDLRGKWVREIIRAIERHLHRNKFKDIDGLRTVDTHNVFHISFFADGTMQSVTFLDRSKTPGFDDETSRAIELAQPLPPPPNQKLQKEGVDIRGYIWIEAQ